MGGDLIERSTATQVAGLIGRYMAALDDVSGRTVCVDTLFEVLALEAEEWLIDQTPPTVPADLWIPVFG